MNQKDWEFRSKPTWQRLIILVGGVTVNLILGFVIYSMMLFVWGEAYISNEKLKYGAHLSNPIYESYGFKEGDLIIEVGAEKIIEFGTAEKRILIDGERNIKVKRGDKIVPIVLSENIVEELLKNKGQGIFSNYRYYNIVDSVFKGSNAEIAGLIKGDSIIGIDNKSTPFLNDFKNEIKKYKSKKIKLSIIRNGELKIINASTDENSMLGFMNVNDVFEFKEFSFIESIPAGILKGTKTLSNYVKSLSLLFNKEGAKQIGGFGSIGSLFSKNWNWIIFWKMTALLSIILAFMNILPNTQL
jgi:Trypsin-like serine proteases, typically periplasmic, contain C-terminal PDZ domain